ncbi:MAG: hypothetical protein BV459_01530 [Thermoplasmata archaeon M11B2D]|nr:MAG: hypothetical protein BV459_01530 [Thermoplasmata archaeon M11B2D]
MGRAWRDAVNRIKNLENGVKIARAEVQKFKRRAENARKSLLSLIRMHKGRLRHVENLIEQRTRAITVEEKELAGREKRLGEITGLLSKQRRRHRISLAREIAAEEKKAKEPPADIPKVGKKREMNLEDGMMFFARLIDITYPYSKFIEKIGLTTLPLRLTKEDTKKLGTWFWAGVGSDSAEQVQDAILSRDLGIKLSKSWIERRRRMVREGIPLHRSKLGIKPGMTDDEAMAANIRARRLRGRGLYETPLVKVKGPVVANEFAKVFGLKDDHPLLWTGTLLDNIQGWSDYPSRSAYYGIRETSATHPVNKKDISDIARFLMFKYNFLARPQVIQRVRKAFKDRLEQLINILVA